MTIINDSPHYRQAVKALKNMVQYLCNMFAPKFIRNTLIGNCNVEFYILITEKVSMVTH